ncbi:TY-Chap domain-containing protein [Nocardia sp. NPDC003726]
MTGWVEFTDGLTQHLSTLSAGTVVIIGEADEPKERRRFVQFWQLDTMIWAELPGDS